MAHIQFHLPNSHVSNTPNSTEEIAKILTDLCNAALDTVDTSNSMLHSDPIKVKVTERLATRAIQGSPTGCLHCEAGLMAYFYPNKIKLGIGKKSCYLCWLLLSLLNWQHPHPIIISSIGTHGVIFPWIAPPGLAMELYQHIRDSLCLAIQEAQDSHTRHSSGNHPSDTGPITEVLDVAFDVEELEELESLRQDSVSA
ncbi:hypothetical protein D9757_015180 [Collybiopsis confluens]|uniref:Uncharacterized protein n=1 Tax=Collybiopsis confluens TaxID=2823264 RepID=A0A8H5FZH0_9AGAR|nr:hypothetical protein D9757_015180 [Collybiopsis confluens]